MAINYISGGQHVQGKPLGAYNTGGGGDALAQGLMSVTKGIANLADNRQKEADQAKELTEKRDYNSAKLKHRSDFNKAVLDAEVKIDSGEMTPEQAQTEIMGSLRDADYVKKFNETYGRDPEFLEEAESNSNIWRDNLTSEKKAAESLQDYDDGFTVISERAIDLVAQGVDNPGFKANADSILTEAREHKELAIGESQKEWAQKKVDNIAMALAESAPTGKMAAEFLKGTDYTEERIGDVVRRVSSYEASRNNKVSVEVDKALIQLNAELQKGMAIDPNRMASAQALIEQMPEARKNHEKKNLARSYIIGTIAEDVEHGRLHGDKDYTTNKYDSVAGSVWVGDANLLSPEERGTIEEEVARMQKKMDGEVAYEDSYLPLAERIDRDPTMKQIYEDIANFYKTAKPGKHPDHLYVELQDQNTVLQVNAGKKLSEVIPVAASTTRNFLAVVGNKAAASHEKMAAYEAFIREAGDFALPAINSLAGDKTLGIDDSALGSAILPIFSIKHGETTAISFLTSWLDAQKEGWKAKNPELLGQVVTKMSDPALGRGLKDTAAGLTMDNLYRPEISAAFDKSLHNYIAWEAVNQAGGQVPDETNIESAISIVNSLMGKLVIPVELRNNRMVNISTTPIQAAYGGNINKGGEEKIKGKPFFL